MPLGDIPVAPPNVGPEPPGFADAVSQLFGSAAPAGPPDPYSLTDEQYVELFQTTMRFCEPGRERLEWRWWQKLHYFLGNQWISWSPNSRQFRDKRLARWIPKPVTNVIDQTISAIMAIQSEIENEASIRPVGHSAKAMMAAQTADDILPLLKDEHDIPQQFEEADYWTDLLGDSFFHPHWDKTADQHKVDIQMDRCQDCNRVSGPEEIVAAGQVCPSCKSPNLAPAIGPDGNQITQQAIVGKGRTIVASPLELFLPLYAPSFDKVDRLIYATWRPKHQVEDEVGSDISSKIQWTTSPEYRSLQLYRSLQTFPGAPFTPNSFGGSGLEGDSQGTTELHLWMKPSKQFPRGLYMKFYGDKQPIVARTEGTGPIPTMRLDGSPLWPWIHYPYRRTGGRLYSISAVDNILKKQDQLNQVDSMTQLTLNRMGNPVWLEPKGAEVERFTGEPGLIVKYQTVGASNAKPERMGGENPPSSAFQLRQQHLGDIEELAGTYDVIKGSKPSGVEAFSALQLLVEQSRGRFSPLFKSRGRAFAHWADIAIELERRHGPTQRVRNVQSPYGTWSYQIFRKADLEGSITVRVEDGSTAPKTALGMRAAIEHLNQLGMVNPQDSDQVYAVMQKFGANWLIPALDSAIKSALREQDEFGEWVKGGMEGVEQFVMYQQQMQTFQPQVDPATGQALPPPPPPEVSPLQRKPWHNDQVHLQENQKWMNSDEVLELITQADSIRPGGGQILEQLLAAHLASHADALLQQQMQQQQVQAAGRPQPEAPDRGGAGNGMRSSNRESGQAA